ncbi:hypothetical protein CEXT_542621 [Caerostris extrusa]|uniref:Uncharacterized protein n=1 Tax=Caerostris extrusa TaxID=172846 RepID=A0AAV4PQ04_CAEEX|nr:hypothetical protein CEXT_542621 [Caerostris extrusa]
MKPHQNNRHFSLQDKHPKKTLDDTRTVSATDTDVYHMVFLKRMSLWRRRMSSRCAMSGWTILSLFQAILSHANLIPRGGRTKKKNRLFHPS